MALVTVNCRSSTLLPKVFIYEETLYLRYIFDITSVIETKKSLNTYRRAHIMPGTYSNEEKLGGKRRRDRRQC